MPRGAALAAALLAAAAAAASPRAADALVPRQRAPDFTATGTYPVAAGCPPLSAALGRRSPHLLRPMPPSGETLMPSR